MNTQNQNIQTEFPDRLVTLSNGQPGLRGTLLADVREPSGLGVIPSPRGEGQGEGELLPSPPPPSKTVLDFISSDETLDRYDEIISASGWRLENYQRNPVFQNAHQYGDIIFTLGKALITEIRPCHQSSKSNLPSSCLFQRIEFATEVNPMAKIAYGLYKGKFLNAVSVGFVPLRWENGPAKSGSAPSSASWSRKYLEQELLEVSAVGIPANPNALQLGLKAGAIEKSDLRELSDLIRHTLEQGTDARSANTDGRILIELMRELREVMRRA